MLGQEDFQGKSTYVRVSLFPLRPLPPSGDKWTDSQLVSFVFLSPAQINLDWDDHLDEILWVIIRDASTWDSTKHKACFETILVNGEATTLSERPGWVGAYSKCNSCKNELWGFLKNPVERIEVLDSRLKSPDSFTIEPQKTRTITHKCTNDGFLDSTTCEQTLSASFSETKEMGFGTSSEKSVTYSRESSTTDTASWSVSVDVTVEADAGFVSASRSVGVDYGQEKSFTETVGYSESTTKGESQSSAFGFDETESHVCTASIEISPRTSQKLTLTMFGNDVL